jgi:wee1-like protein kinase
MSSFASPIPPPVFDSDESDVASQQSTDSSYLALQFNRRTRLSFSPKLTINSSCSQVLPPSSTYFDESTCGSCSQPLQDDSRNYSQESSQQDFILNDSMNIESALSRLTTLSQTPSEISYQSSPISSHVTKSNEFKSPYHLRHTSSSGTVATKTYTVKYATKNTTNNNKRKRSTTRNRDTTIKSNTSIDRVSLKTPDQSPCTRRKNLDYVQESTFRSPKVQRRSRHHDDSISLTTSSISIHDEQPKSIFSKFVYFLFYSNFYFLADFVNTNPFSPQLNSSHTKRLKLDSPSVPIIETATTPTPRYRTRLVAKRDQQAAAHVPSESRQSSRTVPLDSPSLRELTIRRFDEEFHQESLLGHGEFSHVYLCKNRLDGITYAIKASKQSVLGTSYEQMAWRETCAHAVLISHENLVRYHSAWIEPDGRFFVQLEYCNGGSLDDILEKNRRNRIFIPEQQLKQILHQMSDALAFMHAQDLAHLDIKPANIMLCQRSINLNFDKDDNDDYDIIYKLTDLGHVSQISLSSMEEDGDSRYLALEALQKSNTKQVNLAKCDIFSLGLTLYVCGTNREMPKQGNEWQQLRLNITQYLHSISHCTYQFNELLLARMCNLDPNQRPSAYELLLNPIASPLLPTSRESLRHSLKCERQKNLILNKKLLSHYLLTNSSDLQTLPTGINDTHNTSIQCQQIFVSPTQSTLVPQHQYASTPNDNSRVLLINTSNTSAYSTTTPSTNLNQSFGSPVRGGSLATKQQTKLVGSNMFRHYSSII